MKRSDPDVLQRLARIAAGWTPPALGSDGQSEVSRHPGTPHDVQPWKSPRSAVGLAAIVVVAAVATVAWMAVGRARPVQVVPELTPWSANATAEHNGGLPQVSVAASQDNSSREPVAAPSPAGASPAGSEELAEPPSQAGVTTSAAMAGDSQGLSRSASRAASLSAGGLLLVHVAGPVRSPGVVILPVGSRVIDAIEAAGGLRKGADLGATNLAATLGDGQRVEIGAPNAPQGSPGAEPGQMSPATEAASVEPVNLNTATAQQLDALPGVGPVTAAKILAWRATNGRFNSVEELGEVSGIGPVKLAELRPHVTV